MWYDFRCARIVPTTGSEILSLECTHLGPNGTYLQKKKSHLFQETGVTHVSETYGNGLRPHT